MRITWHGHAFFVLETAKGTRIVIDPFVDNPTTKVQVADLRPDLVLVTHGHSDHLGATLELKAPTVAIFELANYLRNNGIKDVLGMNIGGTVEKAGCRITMVQAIHSSGTPTVAATGNVYGGDPCGFIIDDGVHVVYHAGDTALYGDMRTIVRDFLKPDIALLPIGDLFTMGPKQAAVATEWLGVAHVVPMHFNTFPPIAQDPAAFVKEVAARCSAQVHIMTPDGSLDIP